MAEERIYITEVKEGDVCPFEENCEELCEGCNILPTRQEAINRMANALHYRSTVISDMEKDWGKLDESWRDSFCKYAEAALNALLEEK